MIQILPISEDAITGFCREKGIENHDNAPLRGYTAAQGSETLGWCLVAEGEPCVILGVQADDPQLGDGLLRAALFPCFEGGKKGYRFAGTPKCPLPAGYAVRGEGELSRLFAPCGERRKEG